ncbi:MAG: tetratricopeptide repeat protein [Ignavibacteriaceae bacterium]
MKYLSFTLLLLLLGTNSFLYGQDDISTAKGLFNAKKYEESKAILQNIISKNKYQAEAHYLLSRVYYMENNTDKAEDLAEDAVKLDNNNAEFHYWLGVCYGKDAQNASIFRRPFLAGDTKDEFEKALRLNPDHIGARAGLAQYYLMAPGILGGDINKAIEQTNILLKLDEVQGRFLLARIYLKQNKPKDAENEFVVLEKKIGDSKKYFDFYNVYGYFLLNQGRVDEAIEKFRKQVQLAPDNANSHDSLGEALLKKGLLKESLAEYNKALQIDPNFQSSKEKVKEINALMAKNGSN